MIAIRHLRGPLWALQSTGFSDILRRECKATPGLTWDPASRSWCGYSDAIAVAAKRARARGLIIQGGIPAPAPSGLLAASVGLRDYQKAGVDFLLAKATEGCILADDLGLGKTCQAITAVRAIKQKTLIVCPNIVKSVWLEQELPKWWPAAKVVGLKGTKPTCILADDLGLGKQQPIDTNVLTPSGYRRIGDLCVGDFVIGSIGQPIKVTAIFPQGIKPSYRMTLSDGASVESGPEHLWAVQYYRGGRDLQTLVVTTDQIRTGATIETKWPNGTKRMSLGKTKLYLPMLTAPVRFTAEEPLPIPPYLLGQLIANGSLAHGQTSLTVNTLDWAEISASFERDAVSIGASQTYGGATRIGLPGLVKPIAKLGLDVLSADKRVPACYLRSQPIHRIALLQGLMDGDGSCSATRNKLVYSTICPGLAEDVRELVECLGGRATIHRYDRTVEDKPVEFQVAIRLPSDIAPFRTSRKLSRYSPTSRINPTRSIETIEYVREVESVCIAVDAPDHLYVTEHAILTHNTCQAITAVRAIKQKTLIVCPNIVKSVWLEQELPKWWPAAKVVGLKGTKPTCIDPTLDVVVCHYDILYAHVETLIAWGARVIVFDEGHLFRGRNTRRTGAGRALAAACTYRIMLTGTPMPNKVIDIWAPVDVISEGRFGKGFAFGMRYADGRQEQVTPTKTVWKFDGASNLPELNERLNFKPEAPWGFMLRRLKSDVALELPARSRQILTLDVPKGHIMAPLAAMRSDRIMRKALDMAADGKFPQVIELVLGHLGEGHKVVVGTHRKAIAELIAEGVRAETPKRVEVVHGEIPLQKRKAIIDSHPDLICCTVDATKEGINLSHASVGVVAELVWDPTTILQWEGRFGRFQGSNILLQYCIARGTVDEVVKKAVITKLDRFTEGVGKRDDKLREELAGLSGKEGAAARMQALYERMMKASEE